MPKQIATAKPDNTPAIYTLLEILAEEIPVVLPPAQTEEEKQAKLHGARLKRHLRKLRNIRTLLLGGYTRQPNQVDWLRYDAAVVKNKLVVFGVRQEATAA